MNGYADFVVTSVLVGIVCAVIAYRSGKDPLRWFLLGAVLNVLGLVLILTIKRRGTRPSSARV